MYYACHCLCGWFACTLRLNVGNARGVYLRNAAETSRAFTTAVEVTPNFPDSTAAEDKVGCCKPQLLPTKHWCIHQLIAQVEL